MGSERYLIESNHTAVHFEYNGYESLIGPRAYYCHDCGIARENELHPIRYHNTAIDYPPNTSITKCCLCNNPIATITQLANCRRCFLLYVIDITEQENKRNQILERYGH